ncbi:LysE family translocator [Flavobacterium psychrotolerans]|uniref:Lysine transporter LysE n=1 Tax=Flavobacterium psychrotolerans TaxID=2169410 RepID=A0A2U1JP38_9FLAO|nr:LysE family transporter [Flavobacterium psychrotolerans]PWA06941.1 lysine transporter LysE [Flavobacterium psychrotolerans]
MIQDILSGIPLGIFLSFMVGPVFFVLLETSAVKGFRAAFVFDLGVVLADIVFISIAYFSSYRLIQTIKNDPAIYIFGGILMLTYGIITLLKTHKTAKNIDKKTLSEILKKDYLSLFIKGFFLNFINVGVLLFWFLILITIGPKLQLETSRMIVFFSSVIGSYLVIDIGKIILAKQLKHKMTPDNILKLKKMISILLIIFGLVLMFQGWFPSESKLAKKVLEKID